MQQWRKDQNKVTQKLKKICALKIAQKNMLQWKTACDQAKPSNPSSHWQGGSLEIPIRNGVSIVGAIVWQASYNVRVHRRVVRVSTATGDLLLLKV